MITLNGKDPKMIANNLKPFKPTHPGEVLKDELEYRGISQRSLAKEIGISYSAFNEVLNGKRSLSPELAMMMEAALGVDAAPLLGMQNEYDMLWRRRKWWEQYKGAETIVTGHTPIQKIKKGIRSVKPLFLPNRVIMCDTGAYMTGGKLSGVDVLSWKVWQV